MSAVAVPASEMILVCERFRLVLDRNDTKRVNP